MVSEFMRNAQHGPTIGEPASGAANAGAEGAGSVLCAGRLIRPLPAVQGFVASGDPAVNDAAVVDAGRSPSAPRRVLHWLCGWAALATAPGPVTLERVGPMTLHRELTGRWPAMWPYADNALAPGRGHDLYSGAGAYWLEFAPDAIVDRHGKVWRL